VTGVDDIPTPTFDDFQNLIFQKNTGDEVRLNIFKGGQKTVVPIRLAEDPRITR
jgi:S1-C subfamily serine protease